MTTPQPPRPEDNPGRPRLRQLGRFARITLKELREILRDRRTILTLLLMPILIYPLLSIAFQQFLLASARPDAQPTYRVVFLDREQASLFGVCLLSGLELIPARPRPEDEVSPSRRLPTPVAVFSALVDEDPMRLLRQGHADLFIRLPDPDAWRAALRVRERPGLEPVVEFNPDRTVELYCEIVYVHGSWYGEQGRDCVERLIMAANARLQHMRLKALGVADLGRADAVRVRLETFTPEGPTVSFSLTTFIPLILILMTITGAVYPAIDLTAGERERGTLEVLIAAPVSRLGLLFAKYLAVVVVALLTALTNLAMMSLTLSISKLGVQIFPGGLTVRLVVEVLLLLLLFSAFFSALLLVLTSFARSFKEAQAYIVPLVLLTLAPGMVTLLPGIQLQGLLTVVPLMNMVLLARDLFEHKAQFGPAVLVLLSTTLYAIAALALAARIFGAEAVLYSEQSGWSELFHRPSQTQPTASVGTALVCLAILFPLTYLLTNILDKPGADVARWLVLTAGASALTFVSVPGLAAWLGRVRLLDGFGLRRPAWTGLLGALLLGLSLWLFVHEGLRLMAEYGLTNTDTLLRSRSQMRLTLERLRAVPPLLVVLTLGIVPAVVEELFFRGYLFGALKRVSGPATTVVVSALLFGLFHLVTPSVMASERFLVTAVLGLVLGVVCWQTGSVWPGILLHATHNTVVVLAGLYSARLAELGWNMTESHAPLPWLAGATLCLAAGAFLVVRVRPASVLPPRTAIE